MYLRTYSAICLHVFFVMLVTSFNYPPLFHSSRGICLRNAYRSNDREPETAERGSDRGKRESLRDKRSHGRDKPESEVSAVSSSRSRFASERNSNGESIRQSRIARALRDELTDIIVDVDIKASVYPDEFLLRGTSVVDVEVSSDLTYAKVFVSVLGNSVERRQVFVWLCENVGQVKYSLSSRLKHMRRIPDIFFKLADTQAASDLVSLIEDVAPKSDVVENEIDFEEDDFPDKE